MGDSADFASIFKTLVNDMKTLERLPIGDFCNRLHNKSRYNYNVRGLFKYIPGSPDYPPESDQDDWHSQILDGLDRAYVYLGLLANFSVANAIDNLSGIPDPHGYKYWVLSDHVTVRYGEVMTMLMAYCLGEHINTHLAKLGHLTLKDLIDLDKDGGADGNTTFHEYMRDRMEDDDFIDGEIMVDQNNKDHLFSISLLFIVDYLIYQPGNLPGYADGYIERPSNQILQHWSTNIWNSHIQDDDSKTDDLVEFCGKLSTISFAPSTPYNLAQPTPTFTVLKAFYDMVTDTSRKQNGSSSTEYVNAVHSSIDRLQAKEDVINEWKTHCEELADNFRTLQSDRWQQGIDKAFSVSDYDGIHEWALSAHDDDESYETAPYYQCFYGNPPEPWPNGTRFSSSFTKDTDIQLENQATLPVQELRNEGRILSSGFPPRYVRVGAATQTRRHTALVGFNGGVPFTTTSQVFMTPTGLRAVDPRAANSINPFQRIQPLDVGHCIYQIQGESYQVVEIKSIECTKHGIQTLYGLSAQEDGQFHHANGYLVAFNDPAQSRNSAAALLRDLPADKRIPFLANLPGVRRLLREHGTQTVQDKLNEELSGLRKYASRSTSIDRKLSIPPARGIPLDLIENTYHTYAPDSNSLPTGYELPYLQVVDGCLIIDNEVQLKVATDRNSRNFRWTRHLPRLSLWEHGLLKVYSHGAGGTGATYLTAESNPRSLAANGRLCRFLARAVDPTQSKTSRRSSLGSFISTSSYSITFDKEIWPADQADWDNVKNPVVGGEIMTGFIETDEGYQVPTAKVPILDNLQTQLNQKYGKNIDPLYRVLHSISAQGNPIFTVQFHRASIIPFLSNQGLNNGVFELGFQSQLGIDLTLPCLFRELQIEADLLFPEDSTAVAFEYDPAMREMKGNRHFVSVSKGGSSVAHLQSMRAKVSYAFAFSSKLGDISSGENGSPPADITKYLEQERTADVSDLVDFPDYDDQSAHDASQKLIHKMMLYHMNDDDRQSFLSASKPNDLPTELADGLDSELKDFLRNKYAVAFLCNSFSGSDKYSSSFTAQEQKNLWYWWQGNGKSCLSRSKEYNTINDLTSVQGMKNLHQSFLAPYLDSNPGDWAQQMLSVLQNEAVMDLQLTNPMQRGVNVMNQQSCMMHTLAPDKKFADTWFQKIVSYTIKRGAEFPTISADKSEAREYLTESIRSLTTQALGGNSALPTNIQSALCEDVEQFETDNGLDQNQSADTRAQQIIDATLDMTDELTGWLFSEDKGLDKAWGGTAFYQWISEAWDQVSEKYQASKVLKGLFTTSMAAYKLFRLGYSLVGLVQDWNSMDGSDRATVIMEMLITTAEGLEYAYDSWKVWKGRTGTVILDHLDTAEMDQGIYRSLDDNAASMAEMSDDVNPEGGFHESIGEHVGGDGVPTGEEGEGGSGWNESVDEMPEKIPPGEAEAAEEFSIGSTGLKVFSAALGIGISIAMTFSLVHDWDSLSLPDKIINTLSVVVQVLSVTLELVDLGAEIGFWAVSATLSAALPVVGVVLVVVGVILTLVSLLIHLFGNSDPPDDPVQTYIKKTGKPVIDQFDDARDPQLKYSVSPTQPSAGNVVSITVSAANNTSSEVTLTGLELTILGGKIDSCLFTDNENLELVNDNDANKTDAGHVYVTPSQYVNGKLPVRTALESTNSTYYQYNLQVGGPKKGKESLLQRLVLGAYQSFSAVLTATVNSKGSSKIDVVEKFGSDRSHVALSLTRV
ncbi:uncharacterized protein GGS22DRAFT_116844 [Annulohypoxylon maeteangense]|uniref:uncharacterized protein n=1 Tax=Annulohypoxylon maeteangense TaxID=1927788 RepID=UPI002008C028|nr:uncharacterized protein GGS22DRAFT_116844 [Annulohypoxylon maeteangense]KAI0886716.1 hypothetical protein GGS22DRAFT_116844 [Annulohypoxylon maeteangense]